MFRTGATVIFDPSSFNENYWKNLSDVDKVRYYGVFYNLESCPAEHQSYVKGFDFFIPDLEYCKPKLFVYIIEHYPQIGHCTLMDLATGEMHPMCHTNNFRLAGDEEC